MKNYSKSTIAGLIGLVVIVYLASILVGTIRRNKDLQREVVSLGKEIEQLQNDQIELAYKVQYYQTDEFKDKEARAKLGLMKEGENVLILPPPAADSVPAAGASSGATTKHKSNIASWFDFLTGKQEAGL